ncbi:1-phosphofructokinase [Liquorilactobacillus satsumensis]|uniref:Tagatose-6-phosphate kinase n=1 Tax=Liquorilactobacillus satsumensis DSM 16230 = JCM 12392 TaxID=1423801 RepID=A0A0R1V4P3_9LACO|nr:1-phosphofructokinase [Liquorilactobacillus satsumensis]KRL98467.1 1-phosphofructokinase [Liquorilactobacillus satsumensis DSM 16230 = JCM 12392]MCC7666051.1 1-phosphofructokinase [Liquorilactobacillus satsumensis]MCP9313047.1 1-phosphofructokinase [Liquorilactobacillus satsumensis]MCP9328806.1 1-phosphofructokinase [Liquorilactobacillus satsumensis]MCP9356844.1 1-phosphofructokinase [Liquorilactobacillus satsumensis]
MIYTVTVNPSIDYIVQLQELTLGEVNRMDYDTKLPGGKGINVSRILRELGHENIALGFLGGFTGRFVEESLKAKKLKTSFTQIADDTRINVKVKAQNETEINGKGPQISENEVQAFEKEFDKLAKGDVVILSGSLAPSLNENFYFDLIKIIRAKGAEFVIDTTGESLMKALKEHPLVVKPNHHELAELFGVKFNGMDDIVTYGKKLLDLGAQHVLISMAGDGGLLITPNEVYYSAAPKGTVINSVGAGDSMIGGFVGTFAATKDPLESFHYGLACGSATAFSEDLADRKKIDEILPEIKVESYKN